MRTDQRGQLRAYRFETLPAGLDALVSTRRGGTSPPPYASLNLGFGVDDEAANVVANRRRLFAAFGIELERSVWCRQVHADGVTVVDEGDAGRGALEPDSIVADSDALVTDAPGLALCVTLGDCVPVVVFDPVRRVVGLAHAGWGGTVARIASRTIAVMGERFGCEPGAMLAAIGPSIGPARYEVGAEVIERVRAAFGERAAEVLAPAAAGKARLDLWRANAIDLEQAGLAPARIEVAGISTEAHLDDFYSHRFEGPTGRFVTVASLSRSAA
ncbi:MAG: peptidoglycan editing factor PgeF [Solirubrobacterales bacterium]